MKFKMIDPYTKVMEIPNGLLIMRSHRDAIDKGFAATHMLHVPCHFREARTFLENLPDWNYDD